MATYKHSFQTIYANQYNAETIIKSFNTANSLHDLQQALRSLQEEVDKAIQNRVVASETADDLEKNIAQAVILVEKKQPDRHKLLQHLKSAKDIIAHVTGLAANFKAAIASVNTMFNSKHNAI